MRDLARVFTDLMGGLTAGGSLLLLTDFDGTLTPFVAEPDEARLAREVRDDLHLLARSPRVRIGIVSGRALADLRRRVGLPEAIYAGCHGLEVEGQGLHFRHPEAEAQRPTIEAIGRTLSRRLASVEGARVEAKGLSVAVHYRNVSRGSLARVQLQLEQAMYEHRGRFKILQGKRVTELLPQVHWNKGECALWIQDRLAPALSGPLLTLYMGDDRTDELAFDALAGKAVTVRVGPGHMLSAAAYRLPDVRDVQRLLSALAVEASTRR